LVVGGKWGGTTEVWIRENGEQKKKCRGADKERRGEITDQRKGKAFAVNERISAGKRHAGA